MQEKANRDTSRLVGERASPFLMGSRCPTVAVYVNAKRKGATLWPLFSSQPVLAPVAPFSMQPPRQRRLPGSRGRRAQPPPRAESPSGLDSLWCLCRGANMLRRERTPLRRVQGRSLRSLPAQSKIAHPPQRGGRDTTLPCAYNVLTCMTAGLDYSETFGGIGIRSFTPPYANGCQSGSTTSWSSFHWAPHPPFVPHESRAPAVRLHRPKTQTGPDHGPPVHP